MASQLPAGPRDPRLNTYNWMVKPAAFLEGGSRRFGDVWMFKILGHGSFVIVSDPALVKQVFTADSALLHAGEANRFIGTALLGEHSVILLDDDAHTAQRKLLLPLFDGRRVQRYHDEMVRICEEELAGWPLREPIPLLPRMQEITRKVIMTSIFGVTGGPEQERLSARIRDLLKWGTNMYNMSRLHRATRRDPYATPPKAFLAVRNPFDAEVLDAIARARRDPRLDERDDILAMLVQAKHDDGTPMSDKELRDQLVTLLIQGHTSTATALAWAFERLTRHPELLERLRSEAEAGGDELLDAVMKETLRLRPPIPIVVRYVTTPYRLGDFEFPVATLLAPCVYLLHLRPDLYPEPERFRPDRFLERPADPYAWMPFGGGDRHCIGRSFATAEIKAVIRTLVLGARFAPNNRPDEKIRKRGILLSPADSSQAVIQERVPSTGTDRARLHETQAALHVHRD
jgi:cytochrome P450 family 135